MPWLLWLETATRFPEELRLRPDMGNNGYCLMDLDGKSVTLHYVDWMGYRRCLATLERSQDGRLGPPAISEYKPATEAFPL